MKPDDYLDSVERRSHLTRAFHRPSSRKSLYLTTSDTSANSPRLLPASYQRLRSGLRIASTGRNAGLSFRISYLPKRSSHPPASFGPSHSVVAFRQEEQTWKGCLSVLWKKRSDALTHFGIFLLKRLSKMRTTTHSLGRGTLKARRKSIVKEKIAISLDR